MVGTEYLAKFNYLRLASGCDSAQSASTVVEDAKDQVKEYLSFLNWWSSSVTYWDAPLERWMVNFVSSFRLCSLRKRGVLVDVLQHYRTLNVGHLLTSSYHLHHVLLSCTTQNLDQLPGMK